MKPIEALEAVLKIAFKHETQFWLDEPGTDAEKLAKIVRICRDAIAAAKEIKPANAFPQIWKGWSIQIRMGHEFKGTRGSTRRSRGYVAVKGDRVQEFPPSGGQPASLAGVRAWIDLVEGRVGHTT